VKLVLVLSCIIVVVFFISSVLWSTEISLSINYTQETALYHNDIIWIHILVILPASFTVYFFIFKRETEKIPLKLVRNIISLLIVICTCLLIVTVKVEPVSDSQRVLWYADDMLAGNFRSLLPDGYLYYFPHQLGLVAYSIVLTLIAGDYNYILSQYINVVMLVLMYIYFHKICRILFNDEKIELLVLILVPLFLPILFYVTFHYGTVIGFTLSIAAIYCQLRFFETRKIPYGILCAVFIGFAILFRNNYLIVLIAIVIFYLLDAICEKKRMSLLFACAAFLLFLGVDAGVRLGFSAASGHEINEGVPAITFVAMGLQEGDRAPGWYNSYNHIVYYENNYDISATESAARENIRESLAGFSTDITGAFGFFGRKVLSMWNDPAFQGIWVIETRVNSLDDTGFGRSLQNGLVRNILWWIMNSYHSLILFGASVYFVTGFKTVKRNQLIPVVIFIGWVIFHMFWEAKSQYAVVAFILLIPYAAGGYIKFCDVIEKVLKGYPFLCKKKEV